MAGTRVVGASRVRDRKGCDGGAGAQHGSVAYPCIARPMLALVVLDAIG